MNTDTIQSDQRMKLETAIKNMNAESRYIFDTNIWYEHIYPPINKEINRNVSRIYENFYAQCLEKDAKIYMPFVILSELNNLYKSDTEKIDDIVNDERLIIIDDKFDHYDTATTQQLSKADMVDIYFCWLAKHMDENIIIISDDNDIRDIYPANKIATYKRKQRVI